MDTGSKHRQVTLPGLRGRRATSACHNRAASGFSLLELVVTLAVAGVVISVGIPGYSSYVANNRSITTANSAVGMFTYARSEAVKRVRHVSVCPSVDGLACTADAPANAGWIVFANTAFANASTVDVGEQVLRRFDNLSDGLTIRSPDLGVDFISFRPTGEANTTGTLIICDARGADHARALVINTAGRVRVSHQQLDGSPLACE